jgi:beta-glucosidase
MDPKLYPKDFMWGASTSAHQVEGGAVNQWTEWELGHASELARGAAKRLSWMPSWRFIKDEAQQPENYVSGAGVEHYKRYEEDFDLVKKLHLNTFRFGIEWARIEPEEGAWNLEAIEHYHRYIEELKKRDITPVLTIWHWTMPTWFTAKGAFEKKANLKYFDRFVQKVAEEYGGQVRYVLTLNEPNTYTGCAYAAAIHPPQLKKPLLAFKVYRNLVRAHRRAYAILKHVEPSLQIGLTMFTNNDQPKHRRNPLSLTVAYAASYGWNRWFLNRVKKQLDFIGVSYYWTNYYHGFGWQNPTVPVSDRGWYMEPEGLLHVLTQTYSHFKIPIIVTENGLADAKDKYRRWWLEQTLFAIQRALSQGVDLRGYLHWSLLDNFEWEEGWWPKFGLVEVDRENDMKRTIRPSAKWYAAYLERLEELRAAKERPAPREAKPITKKVAQVQPPQATIRKILPRVKANDTQKTDRTALLKRFNMKPKGGSNER